MCICVVKDFGVNKAKLNNKIQLLNKNALSLIMLCYGFMLDFGWLSLWGLVSPSRGFEKRRKGFKRLEEVR